MAFQTLTIDIPEILLSHVTQLGTPLPDVILKALEQYLLTLNSLPSVQNKTWELCGSLKVDNPLNEMPNQAIDIMTNYSETIDDVLYGEMTIDG